MTRLWGDDRRFQRAVFASLVLHCVLVALIVTSPKLPGQKPRGPVRYVNLAFGGPGGPGGGSGGRLGTTPVPPKRETLRDLTTPQKAAAAAPKSELRYPVPDPKREKTPRKPIHNQYSWTERSGSSVHSGVGGERL